MGSIESGSIIRSDKQFKVPLTDGLRYPGSKFSEDPIARWDTGAFELEKDMGMS